MKPAMIALVALLFCGIVRAEPIEEHQKELKQIAVQTKEFESKLQALVAKKKQARVGPELEQVLTDIADLHKSTLELRRSRNVLKEHLQQEHPDSPLLLDKNLYLSFGKENKTKGPLDDPLEKLLEQMQSQYARTLPKEVEAVDKSVKPVQKDNSAEKAAALAKAHAKTPEQVSAEAKEQYMREHVRGEMKIAAPALTPEELAKAKARDEEAAKKAAEKKAEAPAGHH